MKVRLKDSSGQLRIVKVGFSWTVFFFGFFVPFVRGDAKWGAVMFAACVFSVFMANFVFCFIYNGIYIRGLLSQGFFPADNASKRVLEERGYIIPSAF